MYHDINGSWTCDKCNYSYGAGISDDEVPDVCECEDIELTETERAIIIKSIVTKKVSTYNLSELQAFYVENMTDWYSGWSDDELTEMGEYYND